MQVLLQYGSDCKPQLDRAQFAAFVGALCQELGLTFDEAADLLLVLAAVPPDPQDHMAALVSRHSALWPANLFLWPWHAARSARPLQSSAPGRRSRYAWQQQPYQPCSV